MLQSNRFMRDKLPRAKQRVNQINQELLKLIDNGFTMLNECVFLRSLLLRNKNAKLENFPDKTGFECYVNSIHIDDFDNSNDFEQAITFLLELFRAWNMAFPNRVLRAIVSNDEFGTIIKFHLLRQGESWLSEDLEKYKEAILVADSTDINLLFDMVGLPN